jgi:hypothetical protein
MHKWDASQGGRSRKGPVLAAANQHWEKLGIEAEHDKQLEQRLRPAKSTDEDVTVITKEDCRPLLDGGQGKDDLVLPDGTRQYGGADGDWRRQQNLGRGGGELASGSSRLDKRGERWQHTTSRNKRVIATQSYLCWCIDATLQT